MARFRPNIVVRGAPRPFAEDCWRRLFIGPVAMRGVKRCSRCRVTTTDQDTGAAPAFGTDAEPLTTMRTFRADAKGSVFFGMVSGVVQAGVLSSGVCVRACVASLE
jgi:uncharacterized protein YcbX